MYTSDKVRQWCKEKEVTNIQTIITLARKAKDIERKIRAINEIKTNLEIAKAIEKMLNTQLIF